MKGEACISPEQMGLVVVASRNEQLICISNRFIQQPASFFRLLIQMDQEDYQYPQDNYQYHDDYDYEEHSHQASSDLSQHHQNSHSECSHQEEMQYSYQPYEILPLQKIYLQLNQILEQVNSIVYLGKGWSLLLLKEFKWDKEFLKEEYYNNMEKYQKELGLTHNLQSPNDFRVMQDGTCEVCLSEPIPIFINICGHGYCVDCWMSHLKGGISSGKPFLRCMREKCSTPLLLQTVQYILAMCGAEGGLWLKKYQKKVCELFITTNRNYQFCTGADCGNCIKINEVTVNAVQCVCSKIFCFRCQSDDHYPCKCQQKQKWVHQVVAQQADAKWIAANAKVCPSCKKAVQRSMGCNFMACTCGKHFCYMCSKPWQPDHKDHFKCHIFKKLPDQIVNRQKQIMQRMNHCTERYVFNQAVANNYKQIDVFSKRRFLFKSLGIQLVQTEFMETAYRFAIECCEKLKWIYAFTYFTEIMHKKQAFQFSLGEYEKYKENLLKLLAADLKLFFIDVEEADKKHLITPQLAVVFQERFKTLKKNIVNYYTCTKSFKEKFVNELQKLTVTLDEQKQKEEMKKGQPMPDLSQHTQSERGEQNQPKKKGLLDTIISLTNFGKKNTK